MDTERNLLLIARCNSDPSPTRDEEDSYSKERIDSDRTHEKSKKNFSLVSPRDLFKKTSPRSDEYEHKSSPHQSPLSFLFGKSKEARLEKKLKEEIVEKQFLYELCFNIFHFDLYGRTETIERSELLLLSLEETSLDGMKKYRDIFNMQKQFIGKLPIACSDKDPCNLAKIAHKSNDAVGFYYSTEDKTSEVFDTIEMLFFRSIQVLILRDSWEDKYTHQNIGNIIESVKHYRGERVRSGVCPQHNSFGNVDEVRKLLSEKNKFIN